MEQAPRWRRRKAERPAEITAAALAVFAERGFAAARMEDIATRAGVSKAALFTYFPSKAELFRAVLTERASPNLDAVEALLASDPPLRLLLAGALARLAGLLEQPELRRLARLVIAESGAFPEIGQLWREAVVERALTLLSGAVARAQARGEARDGSPRLIAMTLVGPMLLGALWREVLEPVGAEPLDLAALAEEHRRTLIEGLLAPKS